MNHENSYRDYFNVTKRLPLHYQKRYLANISNGSFNASIMTGFYKNKIKTLLKTNRSLALALQTERAKKEELLAESKANADLIMFSRLKLTNMSDNLKKVTAELEETLSLLEKHSSSCFPKFTPKNTTSKEEFKELLKDIPMMNTIPEQIESLCISQTKNGVENETIQLHSITECTKDAIDSSKRHCSPISEVNQDNHHSRMRNLEGNLRNIQNISGDSQINECKKSKRTFVFHPSRNKTLDCKKKNRHAKKKLVNVEQSSLTNREKEIVYKHVDKENLSSEKHLNVLQICDTNGYETLCISVQPKVKMTDISNVQKCLLEKVPSNDMNDMNSNITENVKLQNKYVEKIYSSGKSSISPKNNYEIEKNLLTNLPSETNLTSSKNKSKKRKKSLYKENNPIVKSALDITPTQNVKMKTPLKNIISQSINSNVKKEKCSNKNESLSKKKLKLNLSESKQIQEDENKYNEEEMVKNLAKSIFLVTAEVHKTPDLKLKNQPMYDLTKPVVVLTDIFKANKNLCKSISLPGNNEQNRSSLEMQLLEHCSSLKLIETDLSETKKGKLPHYSVNTAPNGTLHFKKLENPGEPPLLVEGEFKESSEVEKRYFRKRSAAVSYKEPPLNVKLRG